jgi:hypothetical protein
LYLSGQDYLNLTVGLGCYDSDKIVSIEGNPKRCQVVTPAPAHSKGPVGQIHRKKSSVRLDRLEGEERGERGAWTGCTMGD